MIKLIIQSTGDKAGWNRMRGVNFASYAQNFWVSELELASILEYFLSIGCAFLSASIARHS